MLGEITWGKGNSNNPLSIVISNQVLIEDWLTFSKVKYTFHFLIWNIFLYIRTKMIIYWDFSNSETDYYHCHHNFLNRNYWYDLGKAFKLLIWISIPSWIPSYHISHICVLHLHCQHMVWKQINALSCSQVPQMDESKCLQIFVLTKCMEYLFNPLLLHINL